MKNAIFKPRVPVILQDEMSECGLAVLAMVSGYHGRRVKLRTLREQYSVARDGMSLFQIIKIAQEMALVCRALRLTLDQVVELRVPAVLFWNNSHFVVLESTTRKGLHIVDPAVGRRFFTWEDALPLFSGVALELSPGLDFEQQPASTEVDKLSIRQVLKNNPVLYRFLVPMAVLAIVLNLGNIAAPKLFSLTIDEVVAKNDQEFLYLIVFIFGALFLFKTLAAWLRTCLDVRLRVALTQDLSGSVIARLLTLPVRYFERRAPADILRRTQAMDSAYAQFTSGWMDLAIDVVFGMVFLVLMAFINVKLAGISLLLCTLFFIFRSLTLPLMEKRHNLAIEAETERNIALYSAITGVETMKLYHYEAVKLANWTTHQANTETARASVQRVQDMNTVVHTGLSHSHSLLISVFGALAVMGGQNSIGDLFAFVLYKDMFMDSVLRVLERYTGLRLIRVELQRVEEIITEPVEVLETSVYSSSPASPRQSLESISLSQGAYRYSAFDRPVFEHLQLDIGQRCKVAIYGPSGCGKSTLLKVLAGFYPLQEGTFNVNGVSLDRFGLRRYRQRVAYVTAHDQIIDGTVIENILMDVDHYDGEHLQRCVEQASLLDSVLALSNGFNTALGTGGVQLSSGQKQRLLIARALYRQPDLLLFDEPTSHLDDCARDIIIQSIRQLPLMCVVVTHDRAMAAACDLSLSMSDGQLQRMVGP